MYQVAVCDDEPHAAEQNEAMLCHILESRNLQRDIDYFIHCFSSSAPLLAQMEKYPSAFHLLLLDIELENENGLSLAAICGRQAWNVPLSISPLTGIMCSIALTLARSITCSNQ